MGAAEADLDLTGVPLRRLMLVCGVARTTLRLRAPNPEVAAEVDIKAGVSAFSAEGLGHLRAHRRPVSCCRARSYPHRRRPRGGASVHGRSRPRFMGAWCERSRGGPTTTHSHAGSANVHTPGIGRVRGPPILG